MKRQGIYWLCPHLSDHYRSKALLLEEMDYGVSFFETPEGLCQGISTKRVSIVMISDQGDEDHVIRSIHTFAAMPEIQGARLLLCVEGNRPKILYFAAGHGFRDILQMNWEDHIWLERFEFSTSGKASEMTYREEKIECDQFIHFHMPARVGWMNREQIWVESRVRPQKNQSLQLTGELSRAMNSDGLELIVEEQVKSNLVFRFSEAMVASWGTIGKKDDQACELTLDLIRSLDQGERPKVFVAMQSPALRTTILKYLSPSRFEVHTALQKRSLIMEPKFFSPHLVFIEDRLCSGEAMDRFQKMVTNLPETSMVIIVGGREDLSSFRNFSAGRRLEALARIPKNLNDIIERQYLPSTHFSRKASGYHLPNQHPLSFVEIELSARIIGISSGEIEIAVPVPIENYGLVRISSKLIEQELKQQATYVKVVALEVSSEHGYIATCKFCTLNQEEQSHLESLLTRPALAQPKSMNRKRKS